MGSLGGFMAPGYSIGFMRPAFMAFGNALGLLQIQLQARIRQRLMMQSFMMQSSLMISMYTRALFQYQLRIMLRSQQMMLMLRSAHHGRMMSSQLGLIFNRFAGGGFMYNGLAFKHDDDDDLNDDTDVSLVGKVTARKVWSKAFAMLGFF
jgi:hypothetical protein